MRMRKADEQVDTNEILTNLGIILAGLVAGLVAYWTKKPPVPPVTTDAVFAGVGVELGNRAQMDQLISELRRCADGIEILADQKRAGMEGKLDAILEELREAERDDKRHR